MIACVVAGTGPATADDWWSGFFGGPPKQAVRPASADTPSRKPPPPSLGPDASQSAPAFAWRILATEWTERDERRFEEFVQRIGDSGCRTVQACLTNPAANPQFWASNPPGVTFYADCADLPYMLRGYFAWKSGLPFSFSTAVLPLGSTTDIRYTTRGNEIVQRIDVPSGADARKVLAAMTGAVSSAHYRIPPGHAGRAPADHYPVAVTRENIRPGSIIYDPNGHVAVVYKVTADGRIHFIDSHPDNSLTRGVYGKAFVRASPGMGAGFKRWRPLKLDGAERLPDGTWRGGKVRLAPDDQLTDWSDEQFYGTDDRNPQKWSAGRFRLGGETLDWYDFVRRRLARAGFRYDPLDETRGMVRAICEDLKYRVDAVDVAVQAGLHRRPQPDRLPLNIYGTDGDWETYSTPSRDARLKTAFKELRDEVQRFLDLVASEPAKLAYAGDDLARDLARVHAEETAACRITYTASDGGTRPLSFADVEARLFALSFDPYHCPERRWGATTADELETCPDGPEKRAWYEAQQRLRNQPDRTYDVRMGFTLADLKRRVPGSGLDQPPDVSVAAVLATAREPVRAVAVDVPAAAASNREAGLDAR
jgi:hypothetical protein